MPYPFDQIFAADPSNPENVASSGVVTIFAPGDPDRAPLAITTLDGLPLSNPLQVNDAGFGPAFMHATLDQVAWAGGGFSGLFVSYKGIKDEAVAARQAAQESAQIAADAAANAIAPTREVVAAALSADGPAKDIIFAAAKDAVAGKVDRAEVIPAIESLESDTEALKGASDSNAYFDSMRLLTEFPVREAGETMWPQAFSLNPNEDRIYVANYDGAASTLRMDIRALSTGVRVESKTFTGLPDNSWSEACPWFYNSAGDLCFVIFSQVTGAAAAVRILNYTRATLGTPIVLPEVTTGTAKADVEDGYFIVADAGSYSVAGFVLYDWESVKLGKPQFVARINAERVGGGNVYKKNQGLGVAGGNFHMIQGAQSEHPAIAVYDRHGRLKEVRSYPKPNFGVMVNQLRPASLKVPQNTFFFEAEGGTNLNGRLVSGFIVGNNSFTGDSRMLILEHGRLDGKLAKSAPVPSVAFDTGWVSLVLSDGWSANPPAQVRRIGNTVHLRGELFNPQQAAGDYSPAASVPSGFRPPVDTRIPQTHSAVPMAVRIDASGVLRCRTETVTGGPRPLNGIQYLTD